MSYLVHPLEAAADPHLTTGRSLRFFWIVLPIPELKKKNM
jgi:hypothetical protein